jgi:FkbM family methyltransferase
MNRLLQRLLNRAVNRPSVGFDRATDEDLYYCYRLLLKREPDEAGWNFWTKHMQAQQLSTIALANLFLDTPEFLEKHIGRPYEILHAYASRIRLVELEGFKMYVRDNDTFIGAFIAREKYYEPYVTREVCRILKYGSVFLDIGANIGYFSLLAASIVGDKGKVISIEPNPDNCELLKLSIKENGFNNITVHRNAAAEAKQTFLLEIGGSNGVVKPPLSQHIDNNVARPSDQDVAMRGHGYFMVQAVVVDEILNDIDRVDVIKMDIEGAEARALQGMLATIQRHRPVIFTEFAPSLIALNSGTAPEMYLDVFRSFNYTIAVVAGEALELTPKSNQQIMEIIDQYAHQGWIHLDLVAYPQEQGIGDS